MRSLFRRVLVAVVAVLAVGAVASASASAFSLQWKVNGALLGTGEAKNVTSTGGAFQIDKGKTEELRCGSWTSKGTIKGGTPGTSVTEELKFTGCTATREPCKVKSQGVAKAGEIIATNIPTKLEHRMYGGKEVLVDNFEQKTVPAKPVPIKEIVTLEFGTIEEAGELRGGCTTFPSSEKVKGTIAAEVINRAGGEITLHFPEPEIEQDTLEAFGSSMTLTGANNLSLVGGGTLEGV